jgi:hypothetical protein
MKRRRPSGRSAPCSAYATRGSELDTPEQSTEVEVRFEAVGDETRISIEHRAWETIPQRHVARHGFPEHVTLQHAADWWRASLAMLRDKLVA